MSQDTNQLGAHPELLHVMLQLLPSIITVASQKGNNNSVILPQPVDTVNIAHSYAVHLLEKVTARQFPQ